MDSEIGLRGKSDAEISTHAPKMGVGNCMNRHVETKVALKKELKYSIAVRL